MGSIGQKLFLLMGTSVILLGLSSCATTQPQSPHDVVMLISKVVDEDKRKTICAVDSATVMDLVSALAVYEKQHPSAHAQLSEAYIQTALSQAFPCSSDSKKVTVAQAPGPELEASADTLGSRALLQVYAEGLGAYQRKDYATAFTLFKGASDAGDVRASQALGNMYLLGLGVEKNTSRAQGLYERAAKGGNILAMNMLAGLYLGQQGVEKNLSLSREWARRSARAGNAEGAVLLFRALLIDPDWDYRENGKPNIERYNKLAKRPVSERAIEIEAYDMMARAAKQGHPQARIALAGFYIDKPGEDNNSKALAMYESIPNLPGPLQQVKQRLTELQKLGSTRATLKLAYDAQITATAHAHMRAQSLSKNVGVQCPMDKTRLVRMAVSKSPEDAEYLPLTGPEVQQAYLLRGTWEERWTYDICGQEVHVPMTFQADGFGGAHYHTQFNPKQLVK
jgi:TPR repeat protein